MRLIPMLIVTICALALGEIGLEFVASKLTILRPTDMAGGSCHDQAFRDRSCQ